MADLRAEQIMDAITATLTGLTTTGSNVARGRVYALESWPALTIYQGADIPLQNYVGPADYIDSDLAVTVRAHAKSASTQIDQVLNQIRKEVHIAMMTDETQGLSFVYITTPQGASDPILSGEAEQPGGMMDINFTIRYRHAYGDASA